MMHVWIVWSDKPLAAFSSEARARAYIALNEAGVHWTFHPAQMNPEAPAEEFLPLSGATAQHAPLGAIH